MRQRRNNAYIIISIILTDAHTHTTRTSVSHEAIFRRLTSSCVFEFFNNFSCRLTIKVYTANAGIHVTTDSIYLKVLQKKSN